VAFDKIMEVWAAKCERLIKYIWNHHCTWVLF